MRDVVYCNKAFFPSLLVATSFSSHYTTSSIFIIASFSSYSPCSISFFFLFFLHHHYLLFLLIFLQHPLLFLLCNPSPSPTTTPLRYLSLLPVGVPEECRVRKRTAIDSMGGGHGAGEGGDVGRGDEGEGGGRTSGKTPALDLQKPQEFQCFGASKSLNLSRCP